MRAFDTLPTLSFNPSPGFNLGIIPALGFPNLLKILQGGVEFKTPHSPTYLLTSSGDKCPQWRCELCSVIELFNLLKPHLQSLSVSLKERKKSLHFSMLESKATACFSTTDRKLQIKYSGDTWTKGALGRGECDTGAVRLTAFILAKKDDSVEVLLDTAGKQASRLLQERFEGFLWTHLKKNYNFQSYTRWIYENSNIVMWSVTFHLLAEWYMTVR